jgi:hypothetical protein
MGIVAPFPALEVVRPVLFAFGRMTKNQSAILKSDSGRYGPVKNGRRAIHAPIFTGA